MCEFLTVMKVTPQVRNEVALRSGVEIPALDFITAGTFPEFSFADNMRGSVGLRIIVDRRHFAACLP